MSKITRADVLRKMRGTGRRRSLTNAEALMARALYMDNVPARDIAKRYDVSLPTIMNAICGREAYTNTFSSTDPR